MNFALFLHILGAMALFGTVLTALITSLAGLRGPTIRALLVALPAWAVTLGAAHWIEHDDHLAGSKATWLQLGRNILEPGVLVLVLAILASWWWSRSGNARAGRIVAALSGVYLALLVVALLAMSGKWGS